jgi:D-glycero-alpha-D-manno-heptose-7-phosphate kinase
MTERIVRARAPLRISFAGGGTDMPFYYHANGGAVLASTINRSVYVTACSRPEDRTVHLRSLDYDLTIKYHLDEEPVYSGALDLVKATVRRLFPANSAWGLDIYIQGDAPAGSGLGGSSALTIAVIGALAGLLGVSFGRSELAELAYEIERLELHISGGKQDQYEIAHGGFNFIEFSRDYVVANSLRVDPGIIRDLEYHLMLCYTGKTRISGGLIDALERHYREGRAETLAGLQELRRLAFDMKNTLLRGRLFEFGEMLHEEWMNKIRVYPETTTSLIDEMYGESRKHGAIGGKLLGAGAGGYLLLFCEIERKRMVREALEAMGAQFMSFGFVDEGLVVWPSDCR